MHRTLQHSIPLHNFILHMLLHTYTNTIHTHACMRSGHLHILVQECPRRLPAGVVVHDGIIHGVTAVMFPPHRDGNDT